MNNSEGVVDAGRMGYNSFRVDEFVGMVSQGSPEGFRGNRWADGWNPACSRFIGVGILKMKSGGGPPQMFSGLQVGFS